MKLYFKILVIVAAVALLPLQYVLLLKVYNSLEKNLYITVDECFRNAVEQESMARFNRIMDTSRTFSAQEGLNTGMLVSINDFLKERGSSIDMEKLRSLFAETLAAKELQSLNFKVVAGI